MKSIVALVLPVAFVLGCAGNSPAPKSKTTSQPAKDEVADTRSKLSAEDRAIVDAQDLCPISGEKLGSMGTPVKVMLKDKPVFLCCASCEKKANSEPDKTLAKAEELKSKRGPSK